MKRDGKLKKQLENAVQNYDDGESEVLNIEDLTEVQGGLDDTDIEVPVGGCGLGCFQGSGDPDKPNN